MKPRLDVLVTPDLPGFFVVDLGDAATPRPHPMRTPAHSRILRVRDYRAARVEAGHGSMQSTGTEQAAILVALAWQHPDVAFEASWPVEPTDAALAAYADAVQLEWEAHGYTLADLLRLGAAVLERANERFRSLVEAAERADFTEAQPGGTSG